MTTRHYLYTGIGIALVGATFYMILKKKMDRVMILPLKGAITSPFGSRMHPISGKQDFHNGVDIKAATGEKIVAPASGTVKSRFYNAAGGNQLVIEHDNGFTSGYAHLSAFHVAAGDRVRKGQVIAEVGSTGNSTGPHLHLTLKDRQGNPVNPIEYFA